VATVAGGAIYVLGVTRYRVLDSTFYDNAVIPATWWSTASYAIILSTAQSGATEQTSPMWSIDSGPVFGVSTADCDAARRASAQGVGRGLDPSWPTDAQCANETIYQSAELYTHELKLAEGNHVLHLGAFARTASEATWDGGGKIEVVGLLNPTFPRFDDDRPWVRYPGCTLANGYANSCPASEAFWVDLPLHVGVGKVRHASPPADDGGL
jgi:hypothetical protein